MVMSTLLYSYCSECLVTRERDLSDLQTTEMEFLRAVQGEFKLDKELSDD